MSKPVVVTIPHHLGRQEARDRIQKGLAGLRSQASTPLTFLEDAWTGDHLDFKVGALGQSMTGRLDIEDSQVRLEVDLPWVLAVFADKVKGMVQKQGTLLLEKK